MLNQRSLAHPIFAVAAIIAGYTIARSGFTALTRRKLDINFLITVAAIGAFLTGNAEEGASIVFLFYVAELLEEHTMERTRRSMATLLKGIPEVASVKRKGGETQVHVHDVNVGDIVAVRPGEKIPLDGVVVQGLSTVNQASVTGESTPTGKSAGEAVFAGTINNEGFLEVKVSRRSSESVLARIVKLVEDAHRRKAPTERFVERFARYYTPSAVTLAALVATIPPFVFGLPLIEWVYRSLIILVVACPCALVISTPVSMVSAITGAARNGILIKGGSSIEAMKKIGVFAFDKTGTLTEGKLEVTNVIPISGSAEAVLHVAASLENPSAHPMATAIVEKAHREQLPPLKTVHAFRAFPGKGVEGTFSQDTYHAGGPRFFDEMRIPYPSEVVRSLEDEGKSVILVARGRHLLGMIGLADRIRSGADVAVGKLRKMGKRTAMLTGDNERVARRIAQKLGIDEYHPNLLPEQKVRLLEKLRRTYGGVAAVGDGVNDAPALAAADVGIAMGAIGSDVALETADVSLMHDDLSKLPYLVGLSRKTNRALKGNIAASILVKGTFAFLVFPGLVTLLLAVAVGDMGLSLAVILNAIRLAFLR